MRILAWHFFKRRDAIKARCTLCTKEISYNGNTTNLNRHLKDIHSNAFNAYKNQIEKGQLELEEEAIDFTEDEEDESCASSLQRHSVVSTRL